MPSARYGMKEPRKQPPTPAQRDFAPPTAAVVAVAPPAQAGAWVPVSAAAPPVQMKREETTTHESNGSTMQQQLEQYDQQQRYQQYTQQQELETQDQETQDQQPLTQEQQQPMQQPMHQNGQQHTQQQHTQQQQQHQEHVPEESHDNMTTVVNGIGLWHNMTRGFTTPLLAVWDLLDNAFDAASSHGGKLHIEADVMPAAGSNGSTRGSSSSGSSRGSDNATAKGLVIFNTCENPIRSVEEVLQVYKSTKGSTAEHIGENGVGLKQGCATLADLSFCLTRNNYAYGLGVIAASLQKEAGVCFPSFQFEIRDELHVVEKVEQELVRLARRRPDVGNVIETYGEGDFTVGARRLAAHYDTMSQPNSYGRWGANAYVFGLVIHGLKHSKTISAGNGSNEEVTVSENLRLRRLAAGDTRQVQDFLQQIERELPKQYLHVSHSFEVKVSRRLLSFSYWQRRLVEMTKFEVLVDMQRQVIKMDGKALNVPVNETGLDATREYVLPIYVGFDAIRCADDAASKEATLLIHSRECGRLIKRYKDARGELKLVSGSSNFCQGLTIVVDDSGGFLPLNPTKQDLAFGEQGNGEIHHENLISWVGAVAKGYYNYHLKESCNSKRVLSQRVTSMKQHAQEFATDGVELEKRLRTIRHGQYTTWPGVKWRNYLGRLGVTGGTYEVRKGRDTIMEFPASAEMPSFVAAPAPARRTAPKKKPAPVPARQSAVTPSPAKRLRVSLSSREESKDEMGGPSPLLQKRVELTDVYKRMVQQYKETAEEAKQECEKMKSEKREWEEKFHKSQEKLHIRELFAKHDKTKIENLEKEKAQLEELNKILKGSSDEDSTGDLDKFVV